MTFDPLGKASQKKNYNFFLKSGPTHPTDLGLSREKKLLFFLSKIVREKIICLGTASTFFYGIIWELFQNVNKFWQFWQILQFWQFLQFFTIFTILTIQTIAFAFLTIEKTILETCDIWDTDYNSDNWEPEFMTIFVIW